MSNRLTRQIHLPTPDYLGLPPKFDSWRRVQEQAIVRLIESQYTYNGIRAPTGSGKTALIYGLVQMLPANERILYLTSNKGLQDIVATEAEVMGCRDIRGKNNYRCIAASAGGELAGTVVADTDDGITFVGVDHGPCFTAGMQCSLANGGCTWFDALTAVRKSRFVVSNYAKWITTTTHLADMGKFDWIVCDEAGDVESQLSDHLHTELKRGQVATLLPHVPWPGEATRTTIEDWRRWAGSYRTMVDGALKETELQVKALLASHARVQPALWSRLKGLREISEAMTALRKMRGEWVHDGLVRERDSTREVIGVMFDPVWPGQYTGELLFRSVPRVVLMSATLVEKELDILGVPADDRQFTEYPSTFPVMRRPVYWVKRGYDGKLLPRVNAKTETQEEVQRAVVAVQDGLIADRLDRKGIGHGHSYKRCNWLLRHSGQKEVIITHTGQQGAAAAAIKRYKLAPAPAYLLSPSVETGLDFPDDQARWCHVPKLPFNDLRSAVMRRRLEIDPGWGDLQVAKALEQMAGRIVRSMADWGETVVTDPLFGWFPWAHRELFSRHFLDAIRPVDGPPRPLKVW